MRIVNINFVMFIYRPETDFQGPYNEKKSR